MKKAFLFILLSALLLSSCGTASESNTSKIDSEDVEIKASKGFDTNQIEVQTIDGIKATPSDAAEDSNAFDGINDKETNIAEDASSVEEQQSSGNDTAVPYLNEDDVNTALNEIICDANEWGYRKSLSDILFMYESAYCRLSSTCEFSNMWGGWEYIFSEGDSFKERECILYLKHYADEGMPIDVYKTLNEYYPSRFTYHPEALYDYKDYNNGYYEVEYKDNIIKFILPTIEGQCIDIQISVKGAEFSEYQINGIKYQLDDHPYYIEEENKIKEPAEWNFINDDLIKVLESLIGENFDDLLSKGIVEAISKKETIYYYYYVCKYDEWTIGLEVDENVVRCVETTAKDIMTVPELDYKKIKEAPNSRFSCFWDNNDSTDTSGLNFLLYLDNYTLMIPSDEDGNVLYDYNCIICPI